MPIPNSIALQRFAAQLLTGTPARRPIDVAQRLLAVQGQDMRGLRLAFRARTANLTAADVDRAFTEERSIVISWLNRGTLHAVRSEDYRWLHPLTSPQTASMNARRLRQEGVTPSAAERAVELIRRSIEADGPLTRSQLGDRLGDAGIKVAGQALVHLLLLASHRGLIVRGPLMRGEHAFVLVREWLGESPPVDRERALGELARRYVAGHAPATDRDLAYWSGLPLTAARSGLQSIAHELVERGEGLVSLRRTRAIAATPPARFLGPFDPVLFGWSSRDWVLGADASRVVAGGVFRPFALVRGQAAATWGMRGRTVDVKAFRPLAGADATSLHTDAEDVVRFLGADSEPRRRVASAP